MVGRVERLRHRFRSAFVVTVGLAVLVSTPGQLPAVAEPTDPPATPVEKSWVDPTAGGVVRPDWVSASVTARASGQRVEVLSERSSSERTWALPDGSAETEWAGGPVRFVDGTSGDWRDIDTTLVRRADGSVGVTAVPGTVSLGGRGATSLITMADGDGSEGAGVTLGSALPGGLPEPVLDGSTATYPEVLPGVDVRVEVRPAGFEQLWVVKSPAGAAALAASRVANGVLSLPAALSMDNATSKVDGSGGVVVSARSGVGGGVRAGDRIGRFGVPEMWDSSVDPQTGESRSRKSARFALLSKSSPLDPGSAKDLKLGVQLDPVWLLSPARVFPIMVDPTYASGSAPLTFDTFVQEGYTTDESGSSELKLGNNGSDQVARSYLNFTQTGFAGRKVMSASLKLWAVHSWSCDPWSFSAWNAGWASTGSRWTAQPWIGSKYGVTNQTKGFSTACPDGTVSLDMKSQLQLWADESSATRGLLLRSESETSPYGWKRFSSSETSHPPVLSFTYNRAPGAMGTPGVTGAVAYTPSGSSSYWYTADRNPEMFGVVTDPDGNTVKARFDAGTSIGGSLASRCDTGYVASGSTAKCRLTTQLAADGRYFVHPRGTDSNGEIGPLVNTNHSREIRIAAVTPSAPVITCGSYANNSWTGTVPAGAVTCKIVGTGSGYSAPSRLEWSIDNTTWTGNWITQSTNPATAVRSVTVANTQGGHNVRATAISPTGKKSAMTTFTMGWGGVSLGAPASSPRVTTTDTVKIDGAGAPKGTSASPTAKLQWRVSGATGTNGWTDATGVGNALTVTETAGQSKVTGTFSSATVEGQADASGIVVNDRVPTLLDLRMCITYTSGTQCSSHSTILKVPHAFGNGFPVADAGPGQAALWTGEFQLSDGDADLSTPDGALSVSRTHSSFAGPAAVQNAVFGPGWVASFDGDDTGAGGAELYDGTSIDGTLAVVGADGEALVFTTPTGARRTSATFPTGAYVPADLDTELAGMVLKVTGSGASTVAELTGEDGIVTKFQVTAAPTSAAAVFKTVEVRDLAVAGKTTYTYDSAGRVTAITAPLPDGVTTCVPGTATNGCRVLKITYATTTTATSTVPGDFVGRVKKVTAQVNTDDDRELSSYKYDSTGRLVQATDTRTSLTTGYSWTGSGSGLRLATVTPPGLAGFTINYDTTGPNTNKIKSVTRSNPASAGGGTAQIAAFVYNVATSGANLPDLSTASTDQWGQVKPPTWGAAVFGPDQPITGTTPAAITNPTWWKRADLQYTDAEGYTVNSANWAANAWQYTATDYDDNGNIVKAWDERATRAVLDGDVTATDSVAVLTVYNADITNGSTVVTPAGTLVTDTYGPVRMTEAADGTLQPLRAHTQTLYDQGAPNGGINAATTQPYRLPTTTITTAETIEGGINSTESRMFTGYEKVTGADPLSGWDLGQATTSTIDMDLDGTINTGDITTTTRYDAKGRVIENLQPKSNGADAGTRRTTYYTAGTSSVTACSSKPQYAGMTCQVGPAAQPAGQTIPVSTTTAYTWDLQTTTQADVSGTVTSTTTASYNAQDRPTTVATTVTGLASSEPVPAVTTSYASATGQVTGTSSGAGSTGMTYDNWGRQLTYTNTPAGASADTGTTTYNALGQVVSVVDNNGGTSYVYDGQDANGVEEYRGLATQVKVKLTGGTEYTSTAAYDHSGELVLERLPGKINRRTAIDLAGDQTGVTVNGQAVDPDTDTLTDDLPWLGWSMTSDTSSRIIREWTPSSAAGFTGSDLVVASDRRYTYDQAGRLTTVNDWTGDADPDTGVVPCVTRIYAFDVNGNRTSRAEHPAGATGECSATGGSTTTSAYSSTDGLISGANGTGTYTYDQFGRQTTIPESDMPADNQGSTDISYYDSDKVKSINRGSIVTTFKLDGVGRRLTGVTSSDHVTTKSVTEHYTEESDNPIWSVEASGATTTTTRYGKFASGNLGLTISANGVTTTARLILATPRGDIAALVALPAESQSPLGVAATGIDTWTDFTEYGVARLPSSEETTLGYGWLGSAQRATDSSGLILMGARTYNPTTGQFSSRDPIFGGNWTTYGYPTDPINGTDTSGTACRHICPNYGFSRYANSAIYAFNFAVSNRYWGRVPRPGSNNSWTAQKYRYTEHVVYVIYQRNVWNCACSGKEWVWKFGISKNGASRPRAQLATCSLGYRCRFEIITRTRGWWEARNIEAGFIRLYANGHGGGCPSGQRYSCK